jgi:hypothetical protein
MVLRGFSNDNISVPPSSSEGPIRRLEIAQILSGNSYYRKTYDGLSGVPRISELEGIPGAKVAGFVLGIVCSLNGAGLDTPNFSTISPANLMNGLRYERIANSGTTSDKVQFRSFPEKPNDPIQNGV